MITIENLTKRYPRAARPALDDVSLHIERGSIFGLLGPNGAGKTTLLSLLAGLLEKDAGRICIDGNDVAALRSQLGRILGFVPQDLAFYPMLTVQENLEFYAGVQGLRGRVARQRIDTALGTVQLETCARSRAGILSGGLKRRLNLAIGLLNQPQLLCLDEPTVGIDPSSRRFILERIRRLRDQGVTVIYTSHHMDEVQRLCDAAAILDAGRVLVSASMDRLLSSQAQKCLTVQFEGLNEPLRQQIQAAYPAASLTDAGAFSLPTRSPVDTLQRIESLVTEHGASIGQIEYARQSLEALYLQLSDTARDGA